MMDDCTNDPNGPAPKDHSNVTNAVPTRALRGGNTQKPKNKTGMKSMCVTVFRCFQCGKHGYKMSKCSQCAQAHYCNADCQRNHWKQHKPVCQAAVAALARHAQRQRVARAVREKGSVDQSTKEEDRLCVICQQKPVDPVEV